MSKQDRKTQKFETLKAAEEENRRFEVVEEEKPVDVIAEAEARHLAEALDPERAPLWMRPANHGQYMAPDAKLALDRLAADEQEALKKLNEAKAASQAILDAQAEQVKLDEERAVAAKALPNTLRDTLRAVQTFTPTAPAIEDPIQRGIDALDRAQRRLRGEVIEEPDYVQTVATQPASSPQKDALQERVAPALVQAAAFQFELEQWQTMIGDQIQDMFCPEGEDDKPLVESLMRGVPPTSANLSLVKSLLRSVRMVFDAKVVMQKTLERETQNINAVIGRADSRGPMQVQGDFSAAFYEQRRTLETALKNLGTVTSDSMAALGTGAQEVVRKLSTIAEIRKQHMGEVVDKLEWHNVGVILNEADAFKRTGEAVYDGPEGRRPPVGEPWSVFGGNK